MKCKSPHRLFVTCLAATLLFAACDRTASTVLPLQKQDSAGTLVANSKLGTCSGQSTTTQFATAPSVTLSKKKPTSLCIPTFGGFAGSIGAPPVTATTSVVLTSSTINYNKTLQSLAKGKPLFYVQISIPGALTFGSQDAPAGVLVGKSLIAGKQYTAYGSFESNSPNHSYGTLGPCSAIASKGKSGDFISGLSSLLLDPALPQGFYGTILIEVFPRSRTSTKC